jgi:hypothetical protein
MKRKISISFIAVSVIFMLALIILPHHHHDGMVCIVMEVCEEQDNTINDEHTHHNDLPNEEPTETCIAETEYIAPPSKDEAKSKISSCKNCNHNHIYLFPIYFFVADFLNLDAGNSFFKTEYGGHISSCKSAEAIQLNGLRAPPFALS